MTTQTVRRAAIRRASNSAFEALESLDAAGHAELTRIYGEAAADIRARIVAAAGADNQVALGRLRELLHQVEARLAELAATRDEVLAEGLSKAARYGAQAWTAAGELDSAAAMRVSDEAVRFVRAFTAADGLQLSDRVWRMDRGARESVTSAIERAVVQGHDAARAAREFLARGEAVPAGTGLTLKQAMAGEVGKAAGEALAGGGGSALNNAMRLFRTEINRAHGEAYMNSEVERRSWFGGWRFVLSPEHPKHDICDLLAVQNLFGLGKGVYPDRARCPWPAHPNTLSMVETVYSDEISAEDRGGMESPMEALARLDPKVREGVLGKGKAAIHDAGELTQGMIRAPLSSVKARLGRV